MSPSQTAGGDFQLFFCFHTSVLNGINNSDVPPFQNFDSEKYRHLRRHRRGSSSSPDNNNRSSPPNGKASLSLAGLRIDERGGIYLNPLLDSNSAYFKCYVASAKEEEEDEEDVNRSQLVGYILFFNTLDERAANIGTFPNHIFP